MEKKEKQPLNQARRRCLQQSLALASMPALAAPLRHLVLLGDSIFDNAAYTGGQPDVITHLRKQLPSGWEASLLARDGATIESIAGQLARLPRQASGLVLSVGGNNALMQQHLLQARTTSVGAGLNMLVSAVDTFEQAYRAMIDACLATRLPLHVCTIYNGNFDDPDYRRQTRGALALFNDAIIRAALDRALPVIDLRRVCVQAKDYANRIEPSSIGAFKIARAITHIAASQHPTGPRATLYGGPRDADM